MSLKIQHDQEAFLPSGQLLLDAIAHPFNITDLRWLHHDHVLERLGYTCTVVETTHRLSSMFADIEAMQGLFQSALASLGGRNVNDHLYMYELSASHTDFMLVKFWQEGSQTAYRAGGKSAEDFWTRDVLCYRYNFLLISSPIENALRHKHLILPSCHATYPHHFQPSTRKLSSSQH